MANLVVIKLRNDDEFLLNLDNVSYVYEKLPTKTKTAGKFVEVVFLKGEPLFLNVSMAEFSKCARFWNKL